MNSSTQYTSEQYLQYSEPLHTKIPYSLHIRQIIIQSNLLKKQIDYKTMSLNTHGEIYITHPLPLKISLSNAINICLSLHKGIQFIDKYESIHKTQAKLMKNALNKC